MNLSDNRTSLFLVPIDLKTKDACKQFLTHPFEYRAMFHINNKDINIQINLLSLLNPKI